MRPLRSGRLRLVPVTVHNAQTLWQVLQAPDLRTYQDLPNVGVQAFLEMVAKRPRVLQPGAVGRFEWLIYVAGSRKAAGWVSLRIAERDRLAGEIGYSVVRDARGRGVASEAVRMLVAEAFERAGVTSLSAYCVPENVASRRVLQRVGFAYEGVLPHGATVSGQPVDVLMHRLRREAYGSEGNSIEIPASGYPA